MTPKRLAAAIAHREGKKSQVRVSNIEEILKILYVSIAEEALITGEAFYETAPMQCLEQYAAKHYLKIKKKRPNSNK